MKKTYRIAIAQINQTVGDLGGNVRRIVDYTKRASAAGSDIVLFPELAIAGYPPEDLLLKPKFVADNLSAIAKAADAVGEIVAVVGFIASDHGKIYNAAAIIYNGKIRAVYHKIFLPNYGVFDEKRYFTAGDRPAIFRAGTLLFGVNICEDIWHQTGPTKAQSVNGAGVILNLNSSPYHAGKMQEREEMICKRAKENKVSIVYANMVGGQDELVFDGQSMVVDHKGAVIYRASAFREELLIADLALPEASAAQRTKAGLIFKTMPKSVRSQKAKQLARPLEMVEEVYEALKLGLKDYCHKNHFDKVVIGLSGGIDSALVATLAADALGPENVTCVYMPSRYSSVRSTTDAGLLAGALKIKLITLSIEQIFNMYLLMLEKDFAGAGRDTTEENLQARIRGNILMALSNKFGWLVLTTGNKSEMSTGYATLYGDMAGGFAVIKDVPKTLVYRLAHFRNAIKPSIPESIIAREPTAELRPNQTDQDSLPPYALLDQVLKLYIEEDKDLDAISAMGFDNILVAKVLKMVDSSEYKRRQAPPGIKITPRALGKDRRMPITNRYR